MRVLNIGSMNLDYVYHVDHILAPGETEAAHSREAFLGGKGMNQSCALAKAGAQVCHAGRIGADGQAFLTACREYGIDTTHIQTVDVPTGHTVIQIDKSGQNCILLFGGANRSFTEAAIDEILSHFTADDLLLLQNEINLLDYTVERAYQKGMTIALNPSPFDEKLKAVDMGKISLFLLNEVEGFQMTGHSQAEEILDSLLHSYPHARIVLTLGKDGAVYADRENRCYQPIFPVQAVDTTAAGDTFTGYFLAGWMEGMPVPEVLRMSAKASSIAVSRKGAVPAIPYRHEVTD